MRDTLKGREAETQAEEEAGSMQEARRGTRSRVSRITPWAEGGAKPLSHPGCPDFLLYLYKRFIYLFERENWDSKRETDEWGASGWVKQALS